MLVLVTQMLSSDFPYAYWVSNCHCFSTDLIFAVICILIRLHQSKNSTTWQALLICKYQIISIFPCCNLQNMNMFSQWSFSYARIETDRIMWLGMAGGGRPHRFPHDNFSSVYRIFTKLVHMIPRWKGKNTIYFGVIRSKVKVTITINRIFDNRIISAW